jgi:hypothetical protein
MNYPSGASRTCRCVRPFLALCSHSLIALSFLVCMTFLQAQGSRGAISGRAVDTGGGILQGARVELQPGAVVTASNNQGRIYLSRRSAGSL